MATTTATAHAEFRITSWDEQAQAEFAGTEKLTRATTGQAYTGDLTGESRSDALMYYPPADGPVPYVGLEHFTCTLAGRSGTFVAQAHGRYADGVAAVEWTVVPGSATGDLAGLTGTGRFAARQGESAVSVTFEYAFEA
jgi:Protein of unknown function (DUF3224)